MALSKYDFGDMLGDGNQGQAWAATDPQGNPVAIKRFFPQSGPDTHEEALDRFRREYEITANLSHPNIIEILSAEIDGPAPYYVMPQADCSLRDIVRANPDGLALDAALELFKSICDGMAYAHRQERLHRDLKPENILIFNNQPVISDFGLGRRIDSGSSTLARSVAGAGSDYYIAPEQVQALHNAVKQSDVYSLGVILFELTTPYSFRDVHVKMEECPAEIRAIVFKCLKHDPDERYPDATALLDAVTRAISRLRQPRPAGSPKALAEDLIAQAKSDPFGVQPLVAIALLEVFEQNSSDVELYRSTFPSIPRSVLQELRNQGMEQRLAAVLMHYDKEVASRNTAFEYADSIVNIYQKCAKFVDSYAVRTLILERSLQQAIDCHRYYARKVLFEMASEGWIDVSYEDFLVEKINALPVRDVAFLNEVAGQFSLPASLWPALNRT